MVTALATWMQFRYTFEATSIDVESAIHWLFNA